MAYPYSLWSSVPRDGFPPSSQPLSTPPPLVLDNAGYPSYPFEDPDKTYSPAEFASKFPAQPPKCTQGERTSVTDCEIANPSSTSPQHSGKYLEVRTSSYPAAPENTDLDAPTKTYNSQQPRKVQDTRPPVLRFSRSVVALADSARSQDVQVDSSDLNHFPSSSSKPSSRTQQPPEVPTRSPNSVQVLQESIDHLTITSGSAPLSHRGTYQSLSDGSSSASALHPSPLSTHQSYNIFGGLTSSFGEASAFGSNHSNMTNTADTSPVRRQAPVSTLDQPETMPKLLPSVNSVNMETGSTNPSPDSTTDVPTNVPNQAAGPGVAAAGPINGTATPGNQATTSINIEARTIKAALKCSHLVGAYENLAADESTKRRSPMYLDQPPPYLSDEEKHIYRTQYDSVFPRLAFRWCVQLADVLL